MLNTNMYIIALKQNKHTAKLSSLHGRNSFFGRNNWVLAENLDFFFSPVDIIAPLKY